MNGSLVEITLQYFEDCPNWKTTDGHLRTLITEGLDATVSYELIGTYEVAVERGFCGSPTVLIDGVDPFADRKAMVGLACRLYLTQNGPAGSPTIEQLRAVFTA
ncbi:MAG: thioredoxin family protein [Acidimicrobiia bacterium]